ncbi:hemoglobin subunit alpha-like [Discoglossus pictus]
MVLSPEDKKCIKAIWSLVAGHSEEWGAESLDRMFHCHTQTKTYFPSFDFSAHSANLKGHGKKVMDALTEAVNHLDNIPAALSKLSDLHAYDLRVDLANFDYLRHNILMTLGIHLGSKLDPCSHRAVDKFLACVSTALTSKYR